MTKKIFFLLTTAAISLNTAAQVNNKKAAAAAREIYISSMDSQLVQTGYSYIPKKYLTTSIGSVSGSTLTKQIVPNVKSALQGQIAGLHVVQANGMPGSEATVRVRGANSIFAETEPLYIVDGIPIFSGPREVADQGLGQGWGTQFNPLSDMNINDIESVEVLKDAAATAIYGARGANGVILINTIKGKRGQNNINLNFYQGITNATNKVNSLTGPQYLELLDESWANTTPPGTGDAPLPSIPDWDRGLAVDENSLERIMQQGSVQQVNASTTYGSNKTTFYLSGAYRKESGILKRNDLTRYSARMKVTNQITPKLNLGVNMGMNYADYQNMPAGYSLGGGFNAAQSNLPVIPLFNANGTYFNTVDPATFNIPGTNVATFIDKKEFENEEKTRRFFLSGNFIYKFSESLSVQTDVSMERYFQSRTNYISKRLRNGSIGSGTGREGFPTAYAGYEKYSNNLLTIQSTLNYKKHIGNHRMSALAGYEYIYSQNPEFFAEGEGFANDFTKQPAAANYRNTATALGLTANTTAFVGYFANVNYAFKDRYLIGATARLDGSSRFGANNKYNLFPAFSAGWIISEEDFFNKSSFVNELKIRASYGQSGNSGIGNYSSLERWGLNSFSRYLSQPGIHMQSLGSPDLKPERQSQFNLGIDFSLLKKRISGTVDFYNSVTNDLLLSFDAPPSAGIVEPGLLVNGGSLRNRGIELTITSRNIVKGNLKWNTDLVISHNQNKITDLGGLTSDQLSYNKNIIVSDGLAVGTYYLAEYAGVDPESGKEMIMDLSGNKVVATSSAQIDAARVAQDDKPSIPKFFGGFNNTFYLGNFDLGAFMTFSYGNYVLDEGERALSYVRGNNNLRQTALNRWTPENQNAGFPRLMYNDPLSQSNTTRFLHDASYLRMKNLSLGYTLKVLEGKIKSLKSARIYVSAQNLLTVTGFRGWDPEVVGNLRTSLERSLQQGITYMEVPQIRTFAVGIDLKF